MYMENVYVKLHLKVFCQETFSHFKHLHLTPFYDGPSLTSLTCWLSHHVHRLHSEVIWMYNYDFWLQEPEISKNCKMFQSFHFLNLKLKGGFIVM